MSNTTLNEDYRVLTMSNNEYSRNRDQWQFFMESYTGGQEYQAAGHLTKYALETGGEYQSRLRNTPLDNHCNSVISTYNSFLFREEPEREFGMLAMDPTLEGFLKDCDYDGRSLDMFMKDVSAWASVFGTCWIMMTKPNTGAVTAGQEIDSGVRPYLNLITPLVVSDWKYRRNANGQYELVYLKYVEEVVDKLTVVRIWTPETIQTWIMDDEKKEAYMQVEEMNMLGSIPAVLVYNQRSIYKGIGISDIADIAGVQKMIYNLTSENEQSIRLDGHPTLVAPITAQLGSGAGALILLQEGADAAQNPYYLEHNSSGVASIHDTITKLVESIDRMAHTGGVRGTQKITMSGIAMETSFQMLNAKLSEKAYNMQLAEEQIFKLFSQYQGIAWDGEITYPTSFSIRDKSNEFQQLATAKSAATDPRVLSVIDHEIVELLGEDSLLVLGTTEYLPASELPAMEPFEPHFMIDPATEKEYIARTEQEHLDYAALGYIHKEED